MKSFVRKGMPNARKEKLAQICVSVEPPLMKRRKKGDKDGPSRKVNRLCSHENHPRRISEDRRDEKGGAAFSTLPRVPLSPLCKRSSLFSCDFTEFTAQIQLYNLINDIIHDLIKLVIAYIIWTEVNTGQIAAAGRTVFTSCLQFIECVPLSEVFKRIIRVVNCGKHYFFIIHSPHLDSLDTV